MEKVDIKKIKPAKNYSNALFETAKELGRNEKVLNELEYIVDLISKNDHLKEFLNNPVISKDDKKSVLSQVFDGILSDITTDFLLLLNDNSRLDLLEAVLVQYTKKMDEELNIERPNVISAVELSDDYKNTIIQKEPVFPHHP